MAIFGGLLPGEISRWLGIGFAANYGVMILLQHFISPIDCVSAWHDTLELRIFWPTHLRAYLNTILSFIGFGGSLESYNTDDDAFGVDYLLNVCVAIVLMFCSAAGLWMLVDRMQTGVDDIKAAGGKVTNNAIVDLFKAHLNIAVGVLLSLYFGVSGSLMTWYPLGRLIGALPLLSVIGWLVSLLSAMAIGVLMIIFSPWDGKVSRLPQVVKEI